jgi:hypothetical protein
MNKFSFVLILTFFLLPTLSFANEDKAGMSGAIAAGAMFINAKNNLNPEHSDKRINSLSSAGKTSTTVTPLLLPQLAYNFGNNQIFF